MTGRLRRRLAALEARPAKQRLGVVIVPAWLAGAEQEAWIAARAAELPAGQGFIVIPEKGSAMNGADA